MKHTLKITIDCPSDGDELIEKFLRSALGMVNARMFRRKLKEYCEIAGIEEGEIKKSLDGATLHHSLGMFRRGIDLDASQVRGTFGSCMLD